MPNKYYYNCLICFVLLVGFLSYSIVQISSDGDEIIYLFAQIIFLQKKVSQ